MSSGARRALLSMVAAAAFSGCGYRPAHSGRAGFCVVSGESRSADAIAESSLAAGVREGLAAAGALGECPSSRRVRVQIMSITSSPLGAVQDGPAAVARGMAVNVAGRATAELDDGPWTVESEGETLVEVSHAVASSAQTESDARASAARQAGKGLAARLTGLPAPIRGDGSAR